MPRFRRPRSPLHTVRRAGAALLAATALVLALRPAPTPAASSSRKSIPVAVAAHDLAAGTTLSATDLGIARLPGAMVPAGVVGDPESLVGLAVAGPVRAGEPLTDARLVGPGLIRLLPAGQVAAPVRLADLAVAALVHAGDRVDVLATPPDADRADVVAGGALVLAGAGHPAGSRATDDAAAGLLVLAVDSATAERLAAAAAGSTLTVSLAPP
jgi:pilus assembly protein CpaB